MSIRRIRALLCFFVMSIMCLPMLLLTGCTRSIAPDIVVSAFSQYDWVVNILGDNPSNLKVKYLLDNGVDLHNYSPSVQDIAAISSAKLFVYTDSDAEKWISSALQNPINKDRKTLNLMSILSKEEKIALDEESGHVHDESCTHEYDEHIWLSLKLSQKFVAALADRLSLIDPDNASLYLSNAQNYIQELNDLDILYEQRIAQMPNKKLLFADRYPFRYMMRDYDIEVCAAFSGCAADTEISVQKIIELKNYLTDNGLSQVLILENSSDKIAKEVISGTSAQIGRLNSMQSVSANQLNTTSYLSIMNSNLEVIIDE